MMISAYLLFLAAIVTATAVRVLPTAGWVYRAPRLGLAAWHVVLAILAVSVAGAVTALFVPWGEQVRAACIWCLQAMAGGHQLASGLLVAGVLVVAALATLRILAASRRMLADRRQHRALLRLAARRDERLDALVVEHPHPAAYLLPGGDGEVIVTTGALQCLAPQQLAAVLAHERAHARGRHQLMLSLAHLLTCAFPSVAAFERARGQVERLVELCADDAVAEAYPRMDLARALVACAEGSHLHPVPAGAAAAHGGDALERVRRLLRPPTPLPRGQRWLITAGLVVLLTVPVSIVVAGQVFPFLATCMQMA